jgi:serine phosphatase RsbU (regulator of sigma subunit)/anti-sigma regulatory factor (Ser/Thr protein kinase)
LTRSPVAKLLADPRVWLGVCVALVGWGVLAGLSILGLSGTAAPLVLYLICVALAATVGGMVSGLVATAAGIVGYSYLYVVPKHSFELDGTAGGALAAFVAAGVIVSLLLSRAQRSQRRLDESRAEQALERKRAEDLGVRLGRLQAVTVALSEALTPAEVAEAVVREGLVALRAQAAAVMQVDGKKLSLLASSGFPESPGERLAAEPSGPFAESMRTLQLVVSGSEVDISRRWPDVEAPYELGDLSIHVVAPLVAEREPVGVLHLAFRSGSEFDASSYEFVVTLARQCAQALQRAQLYEAEADARARAEILANRLRRLQLIVDAFLEAGSFEVMLHRLLERVRDAIGSDTATILVVDEMGSTLRECASIGFPGSIQTRVPFGVGFAGNIAVEQTPNVVHDISKIEVVSTYLRDTGIVSLAGVPLLSDGSTIGVLHVGSRSEHGFEREDLLILRLAASRVAAVLDRARVREREQRVTDTLQRSLLPSALPSVVGISAAARYVPADGVVVSGDWYDAFELPDGSLGVVVGDVVGHGVTAAATMGRLRDVLRAYGGDGLSPAAALGRLNTMACREEAADAFATVVFAVVDPSRSSVRLASAGHLPPLLRHPNGRVERLEQATSLPIGASRSAVYRETETELEPGGLLVLYTDGLVERRFESIDVGIDRLAFHVAADHDSGAELADRVIDALTADGHRDDIVLVALEFENVASNRLTLELPAEPRSLAVMRAELRGWLGSVGADDRELFDIVVAVNEACSNAIEHPRAVTAHERAIKLDAQLVNDEVSIVIRDPGGWKPRGARGDRGRGLEFMEALMEGMELALLPDETAVRLRRRLGSKVLT